MKRVLKVFSAPYAKRAAFDKHAFNAVGSRIHYVDGTIYGQKYFHQYASVGLLTDDILNQQYDEVYYDGSLCRSISEIPRTLSPNH